MDGARLSPQLLLRPRGLGTFLGVFVPCTCTIFGVVVFLRLGFVVGQAGLYCALLLVLASYAICLLTTLSLCALIADGDDRHRRGSVSDTGSPAKDPGVYAALRQAVGTPLGGALGLAFYLAFTVDVAFYIIGFSEMFSRAADVSSSIQIFPWSTPRNPAQFCAILRNSLTPNTRPPQTRRARGSTRRWRRRRSRSSRSSARAASTCPRASRC